MTFLSTYNSLSIRDWQNPGTAYTQASITNLSSQTGLVASNDVDYLVSYESSVGGRLRTYTRNANNSLTLNGNFQVARSPGGTLFEPASVDMSRINNNMVIVGSDGLDLTSPTRLNVGIAQVRHFGNGALIFQVIGNVAGERFGSSVAANGTGEIVAIHNGQSGNANIQVYSNANGSYTVRDTISVPLRSPELSMDMSDDGNTIIWVGGTEAYIYEYDGNTWSNTLLSNSFISTRNPKLNSYGNIAIVIDPQSNNSPNVNGSINLFVKNGNSWSQTATIVPEVVFGNNSLIGFTASLSDNADTIIFSVFDNISNVTFPYGIQVYKGDQTTYNLVQTISTPANLFLGDYNVLSSNSQILGVTSANNIVIYGS